MLNAALFVSETIHEREITLGDGSKHVLHFKEVSAADFRKLQTAKNDEQADHAASKVIAASLCNADGTPALTAEEAGKLKQGVRLALSLAIADVNGIGASVGKVSPPEEKSGSGTSSS
jgi:tail assembly chaperone